MERQQGAVLDRVHELESEWEGEVCGCGGDIGTVWVADLGGGDGVEVGDAVRGDGMRGSVCRMNRCGLVVLPLGLAILYQCASSMMDRL